MSIGEYESSHESLSQWEARVRFLKLLHKLAPKIIKELSNTFLPLFKKANTNSDYIINELDAIKTYSEGGWQPSNRYPVELIDFIKG